VGPFDIEQSAEAILIPSRIIGKRVRVNDKPGQRPVISVKPAAKAAPVTTNPPSRALTGQGLLSPGSR
jgi:hypothetical protein